MAHVRRDILCIAGCIGLLWLILLTGNLFGMLSYCGVIPREYFGVAGFIVASCSPLVHADTSHLSANTIPLAILGFTVLQYGRSTFFSLTLFAILIGAVGVWLFGATGQHIGASGLIFAYFGFIVAAGIVQRSAKAALLAVGVLLFYWSLFFGIFPTTPGVSWEAHLFGLVGGVTYAILTQKRGQ